MTYFTRPAAVMMRLNRWQDFSGRGRVGDREASLFLEERADAQN